MDQGLGTLGSVPIRRYVTVFFTAIRYAMDLLRATAFWGTILLPAIILCGLVTNMAASAPLGLALLVGLNVLCIVLGRSYRPGD